MSDNSYTFLQGMIQGAQGPQGPQGAGTAGTQGPQGPQGQSALSGMIEVNTTTLTLVRATHNGKYLRFTNPAGCTVTFNTGVFSDDDVVYMRQAAAGQIVFDGTGTVVSDVSSLAKSAEQGATIALVFWDGGAKGDLSGKCEAA